MHPFGTAAALVLSLVVASPASPQDPGRAAPRVPDLATGLRSVLVDEGAHGEVAVLAAGYKAEFAGGAMELSPYFGARAERSFPLRFRLRRVSCGGRELALVPEARVRVEDTRVVLDHGACLETWDLFASEAKQSFRLEAPADRGELRLELEVTTDLEAEDVPDGLRFAHPSLGAVHYGDVVAWDEAGSVCRTRSQWSSGAIHLVLPAEFVAGARGAITVDPLVRAISIDGGTDDCREPDVAYELGTDRWLVVYERIFSARDTDIIARRFTGDGTLLEEVAVATGSRESHNPSVAANGTVRQFLVAWDEDAGIADRVIKGRMRDAASTSQDAAFTVADSSGVLVTDERPDVGGGSGDRFVVVYQVRDSASSPITSDLASTRVGTSSNVIGTAFVARTNGFSRFESHAVTKVRSNNEWVCAFQVAGTATPQVAATLVPASNAASPAFLNLTNDNGSLDLDVAGIGGQFLIVWTSHINSIAIRGVHLLRDTAGLSRVAVLNLHALENPPLNFTRSGAAVAFDGCRFAYVNAVTRNGTSDVHAAALSLPASPESFSDRLALLHTPTAEPELDLAIAAQGEIGGALGRHFAVWERIDSGGGGSIVGALYDGVDPSGGVRVVDTDCGFQPASIDVLDEPLLGSLLRVRAQTVSSQARLFFIGLETPPLVLCPQGCALGVFPILATAPGTALDVPIPCQSLLLGAEVAIQNAIVGPLHFGGCGPPSFPIALAVTDTLVVRLR